MFDLLYLVLFAALFASSLAIVRFIDHTALPFGSAASPGKARLVDRL